MMTFWVMLSSRMGNNVKLVRWQARSFQPVIMTHTVFPSHDYDLPSWDVVAGGGFFLPVWPCTCEDVWEPAWVFHNNNNILSFSQLISCVPPCFLSVCVCRRSCRICNVDRDEKEGMLVKVSHNDSAHPVVPLCPCPLWITFKLIAFVCYCVNQWLNTKWHLFIRV